MISDISVVLPQVSFAQSVRTFVRKMACRILPGISLDNFELESDSVFEASIHGALARLRNNATEYEQRTAVVVVTVNDVNRLCMLLKKACLAVGLKKVADDYLRHSYFTDFVLSQDLAKMKLLMRIAENDDPDLTRVFFHIARVLNGKVTSYEMLDYPSKEKANEDVQNFLGEVKGLIWESKDEISTKVEAVGEKVDTLAKRIKRKGGKPHDDTKIDAVKKAWNLVLNSDSAKGSVNTKPTFKLAMQYAKPILEEAGVTTAKEFARIRHAIAMREYRQRMKALAAKNPCANKGGIGIMHTMGKGVHVACPMKARC